MNKELESDCDSLRKALKTKGDVLVGFILSKTNKERQEIREGYKACFGTDLLSDIDKSLHHNFKRTVRALFQRPAEFDAESLYYGMKGLGTDEDVLIEIICTRGNQRLEEIKEEFLKISPNCSLEQWVESETSGAFRKLLISLLQCKRSEDSMPDENKCEQLAIELYKAGEDKLGTNEDVFNKIFSISSPPELFSINEHYSKISKFTLRKAIEKEYSGNAKQALLTVLDGVLNIAEYYAKRINKSVKGLGTSDRKLIRALVSRDELDIPEISECYKNLFQKNMEDDIKGDTSGDYRRVLLAIVNGTYKS